MNCGPSRYFSNNKSVPHKRGDKPKEDLMNPFKQVAAFFKMQDFRVRLLEAFFIAALLAANVIAFKLMNIWGWVVTAGTLAYPITFLVTDTVGEACGRSRANKLVWAGFFAQLLFLILILIGRAVPYPSFFAEGQKIYVAAFAQMPRIVLGSMVAYLVSQLHDVWAFHLWKEKTKGKWLWLRNNASTMTSQIIDSTLFILIAFSFVVPLSILGQMILLQYIIKIIIAALDTPVCYLLVKFIESGTKREKK